MDRRRCWQASPFFCVLSDHKSSVLGKPAGIPVICAAGRYTGCKRTAPYGVKSRRTSADHFGHPFVMVLDILRGSGAGGTGWNRTMLSRQEVRTTKPAAPPGGRPILPVSPGCPAIRAKRALRLVTCTRTVNRHYKSSFCLAWLPLGRSTPNVCLRCWQRDSARHGPVFPGCQKEG